MSDLPRRKQIRLRPFDYRERGPYLVTIVVHGRRQLLGDVRGEHVQLSSLGERVRAALDELPRRRPGVEIIASVVMPDHVHAILLLPPRAEGRGPSLGAVIGAFKAQIAREAPESLRPLWQARFHDRIIRDDWELSDAAVYVAANPRRWSERKR